MMSCSLNAAARLATAVALAAMMSGCASPVARPPVEIVDLGANAVSLWGELGARTINQPPAAAGTPEERRPNVFADMATLHLAIHRAVAAAPAPAQEAAAHAAGHAVLQGLFPQRADVYQAAYDGAVAALPAGAARDEGLRIGTEQAQRVLAWRADDGRWTPAAPVQPSTAPGGFRGRDPINQSYPFMRPFTLERVAQFRPGPPPAPDSATWQADLAETRTRGAEGGPASAREVEDARFHTMPPPLYWTRNLNRFARSQPTLADDARLMARLWVAQADVSFACFEAKYHYFRWRPSSVITETGLDPAWKARLPTPNHPEYPAAHGCNTAALAEVLALSFGTRQVHFAFDSSVTQTTHDWPDVDAAVAEVREARIVGGMHFRASMTAGEQLGAQVARQVVRQLDRLP